MRGTRRIEAKLKDGCAPFRGLAAAGLQRPPGSALQGAPLSQCRRQARHRAGDGGTQLGVGTQSPAVERKSMRVRHHAPSKKKSARCTGVQMGSNTACDLPAPAVLHAALHDGCRLCRVLPRRQELEGSSVARRRAAEYRCVRH